VNLKRWLDKRDILPIEVTEQSLKDLVKLINRDLADSLVKGLSPDRRFSTAYNAALNISSYAIRLHDLGLLPESATIGSP
jgi:hypothetical protein